MSAITELERAMDRQRHLGARVIEGTEPDGWLTAPPTTGELRAADTAFYTALGQGLLPGLALVVSALRDDRAALGERRVRDDPHPATCDADP